MISVNSYDFCEFIGQSLGVGPMGRAHGPGPQARRIPGVNSANSATLL